MSVEVMEEAVEGTAVSLYLTDLREKQDPEVEVLEEAEAHEWAGRPPTYQSTAMPLLRRSSRISALWSSSPSPWLSMSPNSASA